MVADALTTAGDLPMYLSFRPRVDDVERYDQQTAFYNSDTKGVAWLLGGNGAGTSQALCAKIARFVLETPPPREDTPFWICGKSYDQITRVIWKEKLHGRGLIPDIAVDWDRVGWYRSKERLPFSVPLKKHANGNNWQLCFKSYEQGFGQMMGQAPGGFAFSEQFPWPVFEEVLRGSREYNFPGSKLAEYTPIDPGLSVEIEEMIRFGKAPADRSKRIRNVRYLPDSWEIFYANTRCAMEAGHVDADWFEEFFGMIPEEMLDTRMRGMFASYEGQIFKSFNPAIHLMGDEMWRDIPDDAVMHRGLDWGSGPEHPFVCLWGLKCEKTGRWWIFDEFVTGDQSRTTIDHLCDVYKRHPWKDDHKHGRSFADPSRPDYIRIASKLPQYTTDREDEVGSLNLSMAYNAVHEGIEHMRYLLKPQLKMYREDGTEWLSPRLFIHEQNCPDLVRQIRSYRWKRSSGTGLNPENSRPEPVKRDDDSVDSARYMVFSADRMVGGTIETASHHGTAGDLIRRSSRTSWRKTLQR
ncbi:MAG: hypothetical protein ABGX07_21105, partial [Pirellulaceae bacterium]